ncbi:caveolin-3-like [Tigriopus californicus]|uniref:caveolin-3-like n=1 Tax=Tigriopus californicus TaxID=6832 RepID=UPI0027DA5FD0|nr:caveolin-3-like [Tigriopus californicus]
MSDSKSASQADLNESNMPLLDDDAQQKGLEDKEHIEMKEEKDDSQETEKQAEDSSSSSTTNKKGNKKNKAEKKIKEKKEKGPGCVQKMSAGLNLEDRDRHAINTEIDLGFDDVLAEPMNAHGFEGVWKLSFVVFSQTKMWFYRLFAALLAIPAALIWGFIFSLVSVFYIWVGAPILKLFDFFVFVVRRVWVGCIRCTLEPVCEALGTVFSKFKVSHRQQIVQSV